jgi:signal transduction histidine kinase
MHQSLKNVVIPKEIEVVFNTDISDPMINIDAEQMMQAVTNLEKNAVEAMPGQGKLEIKIDGNEKQVEISISDTGCGIPQENMEKLFTPFFTTKDFGKGTGLGLPLVYGIIKMHTGKISVESNTDINDGPTGTSFKITLPRIT